MKLVKPALFMLIVWLIGSTWSCSNTTNDTQEKELSGEALAKIHCASCHKYPEPDLLDKKSWKSHILPRMGFMMGVLPEDSIGPGFIEGHARTVAFKNPSLFRSESNLTEEEWKSIQYFYLQNAPKEPIRIPEREVLPASSVFEVKSPSIQLSPPSTTMVQFASDGLYVGDAHTNRLYQFDQNLQLQNMANIKEAVVSMQDVGSSLLLTIMGSFSPTDKASGLLLSLPKTPEGTVEIVLDSLRRPVHSGFADFNQDRYLDIITCEFGKWTGKLSWWENQEGGAFKQHILRNMPGAIKAYVHDFNQDEAPDIIALFGQGDEGVFIYYNDGQGNFEEKRVLQFPPSYGSSFFEMVDYNDDGYLDIIHTSGDNADFPPIVKAYHGIRIFLNDGDNQFEEHLFYPMYGAYGAKVADFDLDGDKDIAAISFFPDFANEKDGGFHFLENLGKDEFLPHTFSGVENGRWIVMDAGDSDQDGDIDLVLGALAFEVIPKIGLVEHWTEKGLPFVVLENKTKQK